MPWTADPFDPWAVAAGRPIALMKIAVRFFLMNCLTQADQDYAQAADQETLMRAADGYIRASRSSVLNHRLSNRRSRHRNPPATITASATSRISPRPILRCQNYRERATPAAESAVQLADPPGDRFHGARPQTLSLRPTP